MYYGFTPYVSVADKRKKAEKLVAQLRGQGEDMKPIASFAGKMAQTFWGKAWCDNLEACADYENRLGRGRTYVRSGCVCHVEIAPGQVQALVNGSDLYTVTVRIKPLEAARWRAVCETCAGQVDSVLELLQGKISKKVMGIMSDPASGIFPSPKEISFDCSCPDWASMCKHVAAVLYGIGRRLDTEPELLFTLRGVDAADIIGSGLDFSQDSEAEELRGDDLGALFGIDLTMDAPSFAAADAQAASAAYTAKHIKNGERIKSGKGATAATAGSKGAATRSKKTEVHNKRPHSSPDQTPAASKVPASPRPTKPPKPHQIPKAPFNPARPTGAAIGKLRRLANLTLAAFARELGIAFATLDRWEESKGVLNLRQESLEKLVFFQDALLENLKK